VSLTYGLAETPGTSFTPAMTSTLRAVRYRRTSGAKCPHVPRTGRSRHRRAQLKIAVRDAFNVVASIVFNEEA
jgi:hypothetical protein